MVGNQTWTWHPEPLTQPHMRRETVIAKLEQELPLPLPNKNASPHSRAFLANPRICLCKPMTQCATTTPTAPLLRNADKPAGCFPWAAFTRINRPSGLKPDLPEPDFLGVSSAKRIYQQQSDF